MTAMMERLITGDRYAEYVKHYPAAAVVFCELAKYAHKQTHLIARDKMRCKLQSASAMIILL